MFEQKVPDMSQQKQLLIEQCAKQLANLSPKDIQAIIKADFNKIEAIATTRGADQDTLKLYKRKLWKDIYDYCITKDEYHRIAFEIMLNPLFYDIPNKNPLKFNYARFKQENDQLAATSSNTAIKEVIPLLDHILETDIPKLILINTIITDLKTKNLSTKEKEVLNAITSSISESVFNKQTLNELIENFYTHAEAEDATQILAVLAKYRKLVPKQTINSFLEKIGSDIKIIQDAFLKIPGFSPTHFQDLIAFANDLKTNASELPLVEFREKQEAYSLTLRTVLDDMFKNLDLKIKENRSAIEANTEMRNHLIEYEKFDITQLQNPNLKTSAELTQALQDYCNEYVKFAAPFYVFFIQQTSEPAEVKIHVSTGITYSDEESANQLAQLSYEKIKAKIDGELKKAKWLDNQFILAGFQKDQNNIPGEFLFKKIRYLINFCDFYRLKYDETQDNNYLLVIQTIILNISQNLTKFGLTFPSDITLQQKYNSFLPLLSNIQPPKNKPKLSTQDNVINLDNNIDINSFIIENLLEWAATKKLSEDDQQALDIISLFRTRIDILQPSPNEFIKLLLSTADSNQPSELRDTIKKYQELFDRAALLKQMNSDITILNSLFANLHGKIGNYSISNIITPEKHDEPSISLYEALIKLPQFIDSLSQTSDEDFTRQAKRYRNIMLNIIGGMLKSIDDKLLTPANMIFIQASDDLYSRHSEYMYYQSDKFMERVYLNLRKLYDPTANHEEWQKLFNSFCKAYLFYANGFFDFCNIVETLLRPNEGDILVLEESEAFNPIGLLSTLNEDKSDAVQNKVYLSTDGTYFLLNHEGKTCQGTFDQSLLGESKLTDKLKDKKFQKDILKTAVENGHIPSVDAALAFRARSIKKFIGSEPYQKMLRERALSIVRDKELFKMIKSSGKTNAQPEETLSNKQSLKTEFPLTYDMLNQILNNCADLINEEKFIEAAQLLNHLPPNIVAKLKNYCAIQETPWEKAIQNEDFRRAYRNAVRPMSANISFDEEKPASLAFTKETKIEATALEKSIASLNTKLSLNEIKVMSRIIQRLHSIATTSDEFFVLLTAAKNQLTGNLQKAFDSYIRKNEVNLVHLTPQYDQIYFSYAAKVLGYVYNYEASSFKFTSRESEVLAAYNIALKLVEISLIMYNHAQMAEPPNLKEKLIEVIQLSQLATSNEKMDPLFTELLTPIIEDANEKLSLLEKFTSKPKINLNH